MTSDKKKGGGGGQVRIVAFKREEKKGKMIPSQHG